MTSLWKIVENLHSKKKADKFAEISLDQVRGTII